ncbi:putative geraniol 8-hydroxylase [Medicago truncatula]|uniref:Cytochrome P450 family protein n=1 Tax=Medicago truncatula TaxID=3880 RepID=A0A072VPS7_MEDTR|nr:geraniol 8-hydroxylase [Medicago truncatula]KEH43383.1 cytochrome P450 family protein [Medicago truncatula]RHN81334.1 putative geraniol 8-hydroxylase [Medicago truncatula]
MDSATSALLFLLTCIVTYFFGSLHAKIRKSNCMLPPGPSFFIIMSHVVELYNKPQQTLAKFARFYGPVMSIKLWTETTIIISSSDMAKEILHTHDSLFIDRSVPDNTTTHNHNNFSLVFLPFSPLWQHLRKICHNHLFSNKTLDASQELRRMKLKDFLNDMHKSSLTGEAVDIGRAAFKACINFLSYTFVSQDFVESLDDEYKDILSTILKAIGTPNLADHFPVLKIVDPQGIRRHTYNYVSKVFHALDIVIDQRIKLRQSEHYVSNNDMLDTLLDISKEDSQKMDKKQIKHLLLDLLVAGTDTTAYGLERAMSEVVRHPEVMSKAKKELEETIGLGKPIEESDIDRLPYLNAVIKESLRLHPPAPMLLPRKARVDVEIAGYTIPKGAQVLINEWAIGRTDIWDDAHLFSPERFLGSEIDVKGRHFKLTPFGSGRRICPGSPLAVRMLHLMLGSLINSFDWKLENDMEPKDMNLDIPLRAIPVAL